MKLVDTLSIVIVNWNSGDQLRNCVESIAQYESSTLIQTVVVDNGSTDGSDVSIEGAPNVSLIRMGENLGFGKACNIGARKVNSKYLLFLNPDAVLYADTLSKSLSYMKISEKDKVGICGVQLIDEYDQVSRHCARYPSSLGFVAHAIGLDRIFPRLGHVMADWDHAESREVDHVIGAYFLVRRELFDALHGFDERFFVYLEDLDFSYRAHKAGWRSMYLSDTRAFHLGGGTSNQVKAHRLFYSLRSRLVYSFKHFSSKGAIVVLLATLLLEPFSRLIVALFRRSWSSLRETLIAYGMLLRWLPRWIFKGVVY